MRIALDAMGGDHAPREVVHGALRALREDPEVRVLLVGRRDEIEAELEGAAFDRDRIEVVHAAEVIGCDESPVEALRRKKDNSIVGCFNLVGEGRADAVVSAGNTGAVVGAATLIWKLIPGIRRAGIAVALGTRDHHTVVIDVGANVHCKPVHLLHYGIMAGIYAELVLGKAEPKVGLLNIGSEESKGNPLVKETLELFAGAPFNFIGNVEGNDIFSQKADVVVCEGFVGNVMLKVSEGLAEMLHARFEEIVGSFVAKSEDAELNQAIGLFRKTTDYAEAGGAPLLGVNGTCLISHGRSDRRAIGNAVKLAARFVRAEVLKRIAEGVALHRAGET